MGKRLQNQRVSDRLLFFFQQKVCMSSYLHLKIITKSKNANFRHVLAKLMKVIISFSSGVPLFISDVLFIWNVTQGREHRIKVNLFNELAFLPWHVLGNDARKKKKYNITLLSVNPALISKPVFPPFFANNTGWAPKRDYDKYI